jgi:hypothetical protein
LNENDSQLTSAWQKELLVYLWGKRPLYQGLLQQTFAMSRREVLQHPIDAVPLTLIKGQRLETHRIQMRPDAATLDS